MEHKQKSEEIVSWKNKLFFIFAVLVLLFNPGRAAAVIILPTSPAGSVSLVWNPSSDTNVTGYNLYYGTASGCYTNKILVGSATTATISNLTFGATYYFAATAFDAGGNESPFSNEASYIVPGILKLNAGPQPGSPPVMKFPVAPTHWYEVQATTDLKSWDTIWQTGVATSNAWVQFSDPAAASFPMRFYRLVLH